MNDEHPEYIERVAEWVQCYSGKQVDWIGVDVYEWWQPARPWWQRALARVPLVGRRWQQPSMRAAFLDRFGR